MQQGLKNSRVGTFDNFTHLSIGLFSMRYMQGHLKWTSTGTGFRHSPSSVSTIYITRMMRQTPIWFHRCFKIVFRQIIPQSNVWNACQLRIKRIPNFAQMFQSWWVNRHMGCTTNTQRIVVPAPLPGTVLHQAQLGLVPLPPAVPVRQQDSLIRCRAYNFKCVIKKFQMFQPF